MAIKEYWEAQSKAGKGNRCLVCGEVHASGLDCEEISDEPEFGYGDEEDNDLLLPIVKP